MKYTITATITMQIRLVLDNNNVTNKISSMNKEIKLIQDTMISTLNFSQQEIDNVSNYSKELINEIIKEIICLK